MKLPDWSSSSTVFTNLLRILAIVVVLPSVLHNSWVIFPALTPVAMGVAGLHLTLALGVAVIFAYHPPQLNPGWWSRLRPDAWRDLLSLVFAALIAIAASENSGWSVSPGREARFRWGWLALVVLLWVIWVDRDLSRSIRSRGLARWLDLAVFNLLFLVISLQLLLWCAANLFPNPLLWQESSIVSGLEANRSKPHSPIFGFPTNSQGYHDEEFFAGDSDSLVVVLLGDSFAHSIVPYSRTFATIAERGLEQALPNSYSRIAVHNLGVPAIGMPQYAYLLNEEVLALLPTLVVLAVFIGNDIAPPFRPD